MVLTEIDLKPTQYYSNAQTTGPWFAFKSVTSRLRETRNYTFLDMTSDYFASCKLHYIQAFRTDFISVNTSSVTVGGAACSSAERKEGRKEMFYLTTHSTHFILRLYGAGHMVKVQSYSERGTPLSPLHGLLFPISSEGSFICTTRQAG